MNTKFFTLASIGDAFTSAMENNVLPEVKTIVNTAFIIIAVILLVSLIVKAAMLWKAHHAGEELNFSPCFHGSHLDVECDRGITAWILSLTKCLRSPLKRYLNFASTQFSL